MSYEELDYININRQSWNNKTAVHFDSEFYDVAGFLKGNTSLNEIELGILGDIKGKRILHLQCHFGQDSISLARLGASVVGVDLSDQAIDKAKELAIQTNTDASFICCNIYELPKYLDEKFDMVFTSYGTIGWLPDLNQWANLIASYLKPAGKFVFVEFHPIVWMFDDYFKQIAYNYFKDEAIVEIEDGTYAAKDSEITQKNITWNHSTSEVLNSLIGNGMEINSFDEFDYSPYDCFNETIEFEPKKYRIKHLGNKIPMVFAVVATRK
ncbi:bifunctional 2-polyprenyl-6-hydroxyphenol methylase/3-demethylubiquinol 3-O-methyltransferase UbiG [Pedobacter sp. Hv1]|uniref:class I SAM-dependent methyltransferase n=1 Tax=Pedobacter sp. Hv1 TaxID=1740090 RepID=UPI0006D8BEB7|nr:class I SAM-dependent methyltransferase [Pedobacter sp. Hv1]KQB98715.1 methyltransferase type 12 [Pedobacter sp. Hv1]